MIKQPKDYTIIPTELLKDIKICLQYGCEGTLPNEGELLRAIDKYSLPHIMPTEGLNFRPERPHHMYYEEYMGEPEKHICNKREEWEAKTIHKAREESIRIVHEIIEMLCSAENFSGRHLLREADTKITKSLYNIERSKESGE
jgi:hypothetical protein